MIAIKAHLVNRLHECLVHHGHLLLVSVFSDRCVGGGFKSFVELLWKGWKHIVVCGCEFSAIALAISLIRGTTKQPEAVDLECVKEDSV